MPKCDLISYQHKFLCVIPLYREVAHVLLTCPPLMQGARIDVHYFLSRILRQGAKYCALLCLFGGANETIRYSNEKSREQTSDFYIYK